MSRSATVRALVLEASLSDNEPTVPDEQELLRLLGEAARAGRVTAMKALLAHYREAGAQPDRGSLRGVDELATRRRAVGGDPG